MPPEKRVSRDSVADVLREMEKPFATTVDLAGELDVTSQTIRNHAEALSMDDRIRKVKVGQSSVYYLEERHGLINEQVVEDFGQEMGEMLAEDEQPDDGPIRDVEDTGNSGPERSFSPEDDDEYVATFIELLASRQAWAGFVGLILLSFVFTVTATVVPVGILAAVLAHAAQITGAVGLGLGVLGAFAAWTVRETAGEDTGEMVGETA